MIAVQIAIFFFLRVLSCKHMILFKEIWQKYFCMSTKICIKSEIVYELKRPRLTKIVKCIME